MKYILSFFHSIYFSYVCWFGGKIEGGQYYILWTIHVSGKKDVEMKDITITAVRELKHILYIHPIEGHDTEFINTKWEFEDDK